MSQPQWSFEDLSTWAPWHIAVFAALVLVSMLLLDVILPPLFVRASRIPEKSKPLEKLETIVCCLTLESCVCVGEVIVCAVS